VLPDCDAEGAVTLAERLRVSIEESALVLPEGIIPLTFSLGVSDLDVAQDMKTLIAAADAALYRAKGNGRNRVELATTNDVLPDQMLRDKVLPDKVLPDKVLKETMA
jgi:two-component system cell cycle response regulator